jgi:SOS-response transcriptional repressor LexA
MSEMSARQKDVFEFIAEYHKKNGYSPAISDIAAGLCIRTSTAYTHLNALKKKGCIVSKDNTPRSFVVLKDPQPIIAG